MKHFRTTVSPEVHQGILGLLTRTKVRRFSEILRLVRFKHGFIAPKGPNTEKVEIVVRQCLCGIRSIPQIYGLKQHSSAGRRAVEMLQIQLRVGTLELHSLLANFGE